MRVINTVETAVPLEKSVVCLGYFDGVHRGHLALIEAAREIAKRRSLLLCVHALDRSPAQVLHPERNILQLTLPEDKIRLFEQARVDVMAITPFDDRVRHLPGQVFFREILLEKLNAQAIVVGDDHRFGYRGDTGCQELQVLCKEAGLELTVIPRIKLADGTVISSSAIREAILRNDLSRAQEMLGRTPDEAMLRRCAGSTREGGQTL